MGCNSSSVIPIGDSESTVGKTKIKVQVNPSTPETIKLGSANASSKGSHSQGANTPIVSAEPPAETLPKDFNASGRDETKVGLPPLPPLAFDVPVNEESIIKKHPPKKLRRLPSLRLESAKNLTREELNNKLQEADMRRREILNQRIQVAQQKNVQYRQLIHSDAISQKSHESLDDGKNMW